MRSFKTEAIVIKRNNFSEADRILTVFTKERGKIKIKAKGVRKISSRRASHIELLNFSVLSLYEGNKFPILTEAQSLNTYQEIKTDLRKVVYAYHICELINELCADNQENKNVFSLVLDTFEKLKLTSDPKPLIKEFEIELLTLLGFWNKSKNSDNIRFVIEGILEKKLKTVRSIPLLDYPL